MPHSSAAHSTFITLIELARPQIFMTFLPPLLAFPFCRAGADPEKLLCVGIVAGLRRYPLEPHMRLVDPERPGPGEEIGTSPGASRHRRYLEHLRRIAGHVDDVEVHAG